MRFPGPTLLLELTRDRLENVRRIIYTAAHMIRRYTRGLWAIVADILEIIVAHGMRWVYFIQGRFIEKRQPKTILFYPGRPNPLHMIDRMCHQLGLKIITDPEAPADVRMYFQDVTIRPHDPVGEKLAATYRVYNAGCRDISKAHVEEVFSEVFGYSSIVDPRTYHGTCVRKSNTNAVHDGAIVTCPTEPEAGFIYQKIIDSHVDADRLMEIRILIFRDSIPFVLKRFKDPKKPFGGTTSCHEADTREILNEKEVELVLAFCKKFGLDYGEIDALRDAKDDKLYLVDINNTPYAHRPGKHFLTKKEYWSFLERMTEEFEKAFLSN